VVVLRLDSGLFFATAQGLEDRVRELVESEPDGASALVLDFRGIDFIDSQGAEKLAEIQDLIEADRGALRIAHVKPQVLAVLSADGFLDRLGADHVHANLDRAVAAQLGEEDR
jgi:SulP family sulfate permease